MSASCDVCCQVEFSAAGCPLVQRSPTECLVSECDRELSIVRRPWPTRGCYGTEKRIVEQTKTPIEPIWASRRKANEKARWSTINMKCTYSYCVKCHAVSSMMKGCVDRVYITPEY